MLLAFDLDKTVVTNDYQLPDEIRRAIAAARKAGHLVTVITGRTRAAALSIIEQLEVQGPYSVNHGALVMGDHDTVLRRTTIPAAWSHALLERYQHGLGVECSCMIEDSVFVRDPSDERWTWVHTRGWELLPLTSLNGQAADKLVFSCPAERSEGMNDDIRRDYPTLVTYLWENHFLEVTGENAHKGAALQLIAETLGVPQQDTVAFGDGVNDVAMLRWAGHSVAVGPHAHADVLAAAAEHIAPPEELGVAHWLEQNLLAVRS